jgi:hypothetical protein
MVDPELKMAGGLVKKRFGWDEKAVPLEEVAWMMAQGWLPKVGSNGEWVSLADGSLVMENVCEDSEVATDEVRRDD